MKNLQLIVFLSIFMFYSCKKTTEKSDAAIKVLEEVTGAEIQQQIYAEMTPREKLDVWQCHFIAFMKIDSIKNNAAKIGVISELYNELTVEVFAEESDESVVFLEYHVPVWLQQAVQVLDGKVIYNLAYDCKLAPKTLLC